MRYEDRLRLEGIKVAWLYCARCKYQKHVCWIGPARFFTYCPECGGTATYSHDPQIEPTENEHNNIHPLR